MKICTIVGARPQFVKAAVVSKALKVANMSEEVMIHTGQHFDRNMSDIFFEEMEIPKPKYNLGIGGGTYGQNTGRMIEQIEAIFLQERPDIVLVYGDTDSTLAGALAAAKLHIVVAHVEAGLRSYNRSMPEEINRVLTDHLADILFAPTSVAARNLEKEGIVSNRVKIVGDVMLDSTRYYTAIAMRKSHILQSLSLTPQSYALATIHRAENTDNCDNLKNIIDGLGRFEGTVILPIHPRTQKIINKESIYIPLNIRVIEPVGYLDMVMLEKGAVVIATDSGGVQKEAYFHDVPCVTMRNETEWTELVDLGVNILVGTHPERIASAINSARKLQPPESYVYGDGHSAESVANELIKIAAK